MNKIPFNYALYQTGNYIAECRNGYRPEEVVYLKDVDQPYLYACEGSIIEVSDNGMYQLTPDAQSNYDIFLIPKEVVKYRAIYPAEENYLLAYYETFEEAKSLCTYAIAIERITFTRGQLPKVEVLPVNHQECQ